MDSAPLEIQRLKLADWKFTEKMPDHCRDVPSRLWYVSKQTRRWTSMKDEAVAEENLAAPSGFRLWKGPAVSEKLRARALQELHELHKTGDEKDVFFYRDSKRLSIVLPELAKTAPSLTEYAKAYVEEIKRIYGYSGADAEKIQMNIIRYLPLEGLPFHIDNVSKREPGLIATTGLGTDDVIYDLSPAVCETGVPLRARIRSTDIATLDGAVRMEWVHGVPSGYFKQTKYTLLFSFPRLSSDRKVGHNAVLQTDVYETPPSAKSAADASAKD